MLKNQLRYTLLFFLVVIAALGGTGIYLLSQQERGHERLMRGHYALIRASQRMSYQTAKINLQFVPQLLSRERASAEDLSAYDQQYRDLEKKLREIKEAPKNSEAEQIVSQLVRNTRDYHQTMEDALQRRLLRPEDKVAVFQDLSETAAKIAGLTEELAESVEGVLRREQDRSARKIERAIAYLAFVSVAALLTAIVLVRNISRTVLDPIERLQDSVDKVREQNFDHTIPVSGHRELATLTTSFNQMAEEVADFRREADQKIINLNNRNRAILETFPHPIFILDATGSAISENPQAQKLLDSLGTSKRLPPPIRKIVKKAVESGQDFLPEDPTAALLLRPNDVEHFYLPRIFQIYDEDEGSQGWALILSDVTQVRWLDDLKTNMISTVSHEIKTPLTSILMMLHLLKEEAAGSLNEAQTEMVTQATDDCERLLATLKGLLEVSRRGAGTDNLNLFPLRPAALFQTLQTDYEREAETKGVGFQVSIPKDLPLIQVDPVRIRQVIDNLVVNALKYAPQGSKVLVSARKEGADYVRFSVIDEGAGVPEEVHGKIFERFFRAPNQEVEGTGLGLSISREIVDAHQGRIGFDSKAGHPTVFHFDLPLS